MAKKGKTGILNLFPRGFSPNRVAFGDYQLADSRKTP
jgi:hypothetical protein